MKYWDFSIINVGMLNLRYYSASKVLKD